MLTYPVGTLNPKVGGIPRDGLIGEWLFSGNANDTSGNGNDGTVSGATLTTDRHGASNSAYLFASAAIDRITLNSALNDQLIMTYSWWTYFNTLNAAQWWFSNGGVTTKLYFAYLATSASPTPDTIRHNSGDGVTGMSALDDFITTGAWFHYILSRNGVNLSLYINNITFGSQVIGGTTLSDTQYFGIRNNQGIFQDGILGKLDDIRVYNRVLTANERTILYNE